MTTTSSIKMIEKLKQSIHPKKKSPEEKKEEDEELLPYIIDFLTPALLEEARSKLNETDEVKPLALVELRRLISEDKRLLTPTTDEFLLPFLRSRKFNVKRSFKLLQNFWAFRKEYQFIYDTSNPEPVRQLILRNFFGFLSTRDRNGCLILIFKVGQWDPDLDTYENMFRAITAILLHSIQFPATQVAGYRMICDARGLTWKQLKHFTPSNVLLLVRSTQFCFPGRYKGCHILSENKLFNLLWAITYPLLTSKLKKRVILHGSDTKPLLDYIHPTALPDEYGGCAGPFDNSKWADVIDQNTDYVFSMLSYGYKD